MTREEQKLQAADAYIKEFYQKRKEYEDII